MAGKVGRLMDRKYATKNLFNSTLEHPIDRYGTSKNERRIILTF